MKRLYLIILSLCALVGNAQNTLDDIGRITIQAYVPATDDVPREAADFLQSKLSQIITSNGIADNDYCERFVLTAKINVLTKDIVAGPPQRISQKMEITLMLGDIQENKVYSAHTISAVGVGTNLNKALIAAFKNVRPNNPQLKSFINEGKEKIISYYEAQCSQLITEAKSLRGQQKYEEAIWLLSSVPDVCSDCYDEVCSLSSTIYMDMINNRGATLLKQAQAAWAQQPNKQGAETAMSYISQINSSATCMTQVNALTNEITQKLMSDEKRDWEFMLEQYRDRQKREAEERANAQKRYEAELIAREKRESEERAYAQQRFDQRQKTARAYISACRDVAMEYYKSRPKTVNYYTKINQWNY